MRRCCTWVPVGFSSTVVLVPSAVFSRRRRWGGSDDSDPSSHNSRDQHVSNKCSARFLRRRPTRVAWCTSAMWTPCRMTSSTASGGEGGSDGGGGGGGVEDHGPRTTVAAGTGSSHPVALNSSSASVSSEADVTASSVLELLKTTPLITRDPVSSRKNAAAGKGRAAPSSGGRRRTHSAKEREVETAALQPSRAEVKDGPMDITAQDGEDGKKKASSKERKSTGRKRPNWRRTGESDKRSSAFGTSDTSGVVNSTIRTTTSTTRTPAEETKQTVIIDSPADASSILSPTATASPALNSFTSYAELQKVERRRSKLSVNEAEFAAGISERLCPLMPRIPVLHEIHFSDAIVREVDSAAYFALTVNHPRVPGELLVSGDNQPSPGSAPTPAEQQVPDHDIGDPALVEVATTTTTAGGVLGGGTSGGTDAEAEPPLPSNHPLSDEAFADFGIELDEEEEADRVGRQSQQEEGAAADAGIEAMKLDGVLAPPLVSSEGSFRSVPQKTVPFGSETLPHLVQHLRDPPPGRSGSSPIQEGENVDGEGNTTAALSDALANTPLVMFHRPISPSDCICLLDFLLYLREQTYSDMPTWLQRVVETTKEYLAQKGISEAEKDNEEAFDIDDIGVEVDTAAGGGGSQGLESDSAAATASPSSRVLRMEDVIRYLDGAPAPRKGFTEDLSSSAASAAVSGGGAAADGLRKPAFLFTLYLENVSIQNAIGHICMLFALPLQSFHTRTQSGKMTCSSVRCALAPGCLSRHHLLLLNTMRHPGFVIRVSDVYAVPQVRAGVSADVTNFFGALARWQPVYYTEILLRRVSASSLLDADHGVSGMSMDGMVDTKDPRQVIQTRLRAMETFGAVHFCLNRDTALARAASDVIHRYYKSAMLHALQRPNPPLALKQFFQAPNEVTASKARAASTDATIRAALKAFLQVKGDWFATVKRTPYAWRRRWINALRGLIWNQMASKRIRHAHKMRREQRAKSGVVGKESVYDSLTALVNGAVIVGDVVVRPEFRQDARRRQLLTLKADYLMLVSSEAEAAECTLEDVFLPFLRGVYPEHLFAPEASNHPVMRRSTMMAMLQKRSAAALLVGLPPAAQHLLDVRCNTSPLLFRRLMIRPLALSATILEDKPPMLATQHHYDACRLLQPDRWPQRYTAESRYTKGATKVPSMGLSAADKAADEEEATRVMELLSLPPTATGGDLNHHREIPDSLLLSPTTTTTNSTAADGALIPQAAVLEHSSIGRRLPPGVLPSEFFAPPEPSDYLVVGQTRRFDHPRNAPSSSSSAGGANAMLLESTPLTPKQHLQDRLYTLHIRAVCHSTAVGLSQILREYFILMGVKESEERSGMGGQSMRPGEGGGSTTGSGPAYPYMDDVLQHKIHRLWRELDPETPLLTAEKYCPVCFNRDHESQEQCAEYLWKRQQERRRREQVQRVAQRSSSTAQGKTTDETALATTAYSSGERAHHHPPRASELRRRERMSDEAKRNRPMMVLPSARVRLWMKWHMRRPSRLSKWGVRFTKSSLVLTSLEEPEVVVKAEVWCQAIRQDHRSAGDTKRLENGQLDGEATNEEEEVTVVDVEHLLQRWKSSTTTVVMDAGAQDQEMVAALRAFLLTALSTSSSSPSTGGDGSGVESDGTSVSLSGTTQLAWLKQMLSGTIELQGEEESSAVMTPRDKGKENGASVPLQHCQWKLCAVDEREVRTVNDVAEAFLAFSHHRNISLVLSTPLLDATDVRVFQTENSPTEDIPDLGGAVSLLPNHQSLVPAAQLNQNSRVASHLQHVVCRDEDLSQKDALPPLPQALFVTIREPLQPNQQNKTSWGLSIRANELTLSNLKQWVLKALKSEKRCKKEGSPSVFFEASSPPPSSLFFSSWAEILSRHFDATLRCFSSFEEVPEGEEPLDFFHYYVVFRINSSRILRIKDVPKYLPSVNSGTPLKLELRLRQRHNPAVEKKSTDNLEALMRHNQILDTVVENMRSANELYTHSSPTPLSIKSSQAEETYRESHDTNGKEAEKVPNALETPEAAVVPTCRKDVMCVPADQKILSPADLVARSATVAVHRPIPSHLLSGAAVSNPAGLPRWGIRLQKNSLRVLHVEHRNGYHFHVYAYTTSQVRRIERGLRAHVIPQTSSSSSPTSQDSQTASSLTNEKPVRAYRTHLYVLLEVNHQGVQSPEEARVALRQASQGNSSPSLPRGKPHNSVGEVVEVGVVTETERSPEKKPVAAKSAAPPQEEIPPSSAPQVSASSSSSSIPEVVLLRILDYPLLRVVLPISRGWGDKSKASKFSIFSPIGIHVDPDVCVVGFSNNSPVEQAIHAHGIGARCSLLRLLPRNATEEQSHLQSLSKWNDVDWLAKKVREVCAVSSLVEPLLAVASALLLSEGNTSSSLEAEQRQDQRLGTYDWSKDDDDDDEVDAGINHKVDHHEALTPDNNDTTTTNNNNNEKNNVAAGTSRPTDEEEKEKVDASETESERNPGVTDQTSVFREAVSRLRVALEAVEAELKQCSRVDGIQVLQAEILRHSLDLHFPLINDRHHSNSKEILPSSDETKFSFETLLKDWEQVYDLFRWRVVYAQDAKKAIQSPQDLAEVFAPGVVEETVVLQQCVLV